MTRLRIMRRCSLRGAAATVLELGAGAPEADRTAEGATSAELAGEGARATRPEELEPRLIRLRSARTSAADCALRSRSFSRHFRMTSPNGGGSSGFRSVGGGGLFSRMALKITAEVG